MAAPVSEHQLLCSICSVCRRTQLCFLNDHGYIHLCVLSLGVVHILSQEWEPDIIIGFIIGYFLQAGWLRKKYSPSQSMLGDLKSHLNHFHQENTRECCMCGIQELSYLSISASLEYIWMRRGSSLAPFWFPSILCPQVLPLQGWQFPQATLPLGRICFILYKHGSPLDL